MAIVKEIKTLSKHSGDVKKEAIVDLIEMINEIGRVNGVDDKILKSICKGIEKGIKSGVNDKQLLTIENVACNSVNINNDVLKELSKPEKEKILSWYSTIVGEYIGLTGDIFNGIMEECKNYKFEELYNTLKKMNIVVTKISEEELVPFAKNLDDVNSDDYKSLKNKIESRIEEIKIIDSFNDSEIDYVQYVDKALKLAIESMKKISRNFNSKRKEILYWNIANSEDNINLADYALNALIGNSVKRLPKQQ